MACELYFLGGFSVFSSSSFVTMYNTISIMFKKLLLPVILITLAGIQLSALAEDFYVPGRLLVSLNEQPGIIDSSEDVILTDNPAFNEALADCWISDIQPLIPTLRSTGNGISDELSKIYDVTNSLRCLLSPLT